jgi:hypothetical protein
VTTKRATLQVLQTDIFAAKPSLSLFHLFALAADAWLLMSFIIIGCISRFLAQGRCNYFCLLPVSFCAVGARSPDASINAFNCKTAF